MRVWGACPFWAKAFFLFSLFFCAVGWGAHNDAISFFARKFGNIHAYVVVVNLNSSKVKVSLSFPTHPLNNQTFPHERFDALVAQTLPTAAINGTYYDTRSFKPVSLLVAHGELVQAGQRGVAVCFDAQNRVQFFRIRNWRNFPWQDFNVILSSGPTLVHHGKISIFPQEEGFHDPQIFKPSQRSALGLTRNNKLLLVSVATPIRLRELARIMKKLGAYEAVNLDGGSSAGLYYRGKFWVHPSRTLTNVLTIYEKKEAVSFRE
jgi:exopolysaccharide biosynthesis protein